MRRARHNKSPLKILFISSEVAPFSKTGGLGDVAASLPKALKNAGHEVRVVTPLYKTIRERKYGLREVARLKSLAIEMGDNSFECAVKSGFIPGSKVQVYFVENNDFYGRLTPYTNPDNDRDYPDNHIRFAFLSHAALRLTIHLGWIPDIIHCNDWQTALIPYLIKNNSEYGNELSASRTVLHLHNLVYQGVFPVSHRNQLGFSASELTPGEPLEFYEQMSFLKAGICAADHLVTVSPTYSNEIRTISDMGCGLEGVLSKRKEVLTGVINGIDTDVWNPGSDKLIPYTYNSKTFVENKALNKNELQERLGLPPDPDVPVIGMISRLVEQKGLSLLNKVSAELLSLPAQFVFLGVGEKRYEQMLKEWADRNPEKVSATLRFENDLAHLIEAGSDMFLMPSQFEPCGLNQMYSLLYGTIPIVRKTGGLADTVERFDPDRGVGNGFVFEEYDGRDMIDEINRAIVLFHHKSIWQSLQFCGMNLDFGWTQTADQFTQLYKEVMSKPPSEMK